MLILLITSTCGTETLTELFSPISTFDIWDVSTDAGLKSSTNIKSWQSSERYSKISGLLQKKKKQIMVILKLTLKKYTVHICDWSDP